MLYPIDTSMTPRKRIPSLWVSMAFGLFAMCVSADEKRVTIPLQLPFQQVSSSSVAAPAVDGQGELVTTPFIQTVVEAAQSSSAPAATPQIKLPIPQTAPPPQPAPKSVELVVDPEVPVRHVPELSSEPVKAEPYPEGHPEAFVAQFEDYVARRIAPYVPGVAVAIVADGQVKSLQTYGVRRAGTREKLTPDTVFRLASVSKPVAATAVAIMVKDGQLTWDAKVTNELPDVKFKTARYANQITLQHLLSQSIGLPTHTNSSLIEAGMSYAEAVRRLRFANFVCPPGKCYAYQNITYNLAGDMVSTHYGKPFETFVEDKLFEPLSMQSASFGLESYLAAPNRATPHVASGKRWVPTSVTPNYYRMSSAAGVNASIMDMSHFLLAQLGKYPDVLPIDTLNQIQSRITKNSPAQNHYGTRRGIGNTAYGLGWRMFDYGRYKNFAHHGGWVKGFRSEVVFNRELGIGMVLLTNSETRLARNVIFKFMDLHEIAQQAAQKTANKDTTKAEAKETANAGGFRLSPIANDY